MTELKLEVGKVYDDKNGSRWLIIFKEDFASSHAILLSDTSNITYLNQIILKRGHKALFYNLDYHFTGNLLNLVKLSDNQFPGVVDEKKTSIGDKLYIGIMEAMLEHTIPNLENEVKALRKKVAALEKRQSIGGRSGMPIQGGTRLYYHHHPSYDRDENGNGGGKL